MYVIAITNQKGGCGKTTTAVNLSACLGLKNKRTLLVDIDPQAHASIGVSSGQDFTSQKTISDALLHPEEVDSSIVHLIQPIAENFDLVPSNAVLANVEQQLVSVLQREERLYLAIQEVSDSYDYVIIDCPPSIGILTANAFIACDEVMIPIETSFFALHGVARLLEVIQSLRTRRTRSFRLSAIATMYDSRTNLAKEVLQDISNYFGDMLYKTVIRRNIKLQEAASFGLPITQYAERSTGYQSYMALADEVIAISGNFQPATLF